MIVAVTGHRVEDCEPESVVRSKLRKALQALPAEEDNTVICGLANGVDLWAADEAIALGYEVWAAKPWKGHGPRVGDVTLYEFVIAHASQVVNVDESDTYPGPWVYHKRNEWMVDHAEGVLAYWSGKKKGGTYACVNYANKKDVHVRNCFDD